MVKHWNGLLKEKGGRKEGGRKEGGRREKGGRVLFKDAFALNQGIDF